MSVQRDFGPKKSYWVSHQEGSTPQCLCPHCRKPRDEKKRCSGCLVVGYCSKECQKQDWKLHHQVQCQAYQEFGIRDEDWEPCSACQTRTRSRCPGCKLEPYCSLDCLRKHYTTHHWMHCAWQDYSSEVKVRHAQTILYDLGLLPELISLIVPYVYPHESYEETHHGLPLERTLECDAPFLLDGHLQGDQIRTHIRPSDSFFVNAPLWDCPLDWRQFPVSGFTPCWSLEDRVLVCFVTRAATWRYEIKDPTLMHPRHISLDPLGRTMAWVKDDHHHITIKTLPDLETLYQQQVDTGKEPRKIWRISVGRNMIAVMTEDAEVQILHFRQRRTQTLGKFLNFTGKGCLTLDEVNCQVAYMEESDRSISIELFSFLEME